MKAKNSMIVLMFVMAILLFVLCVNPAFIVALLGAKMAVNVTFGLFCVCGVMFTYKFLSL